ncbi:exodeoxyribonuclease V subunit beta [Neisseria animalis]|uniref:RecBCD enzyme subunit RecB n=1 Tax=Neisseria animalis TaxID=492 RepID=A0A5P3MQ41_NEIAN|nr:exodeoxyribonuclease V subunit beta [Neisseria animalis]QEY23185.1 exodeoxyribonuclease V subunit beta [Neisseria animalis]ROW32513.1 exodeoxyribonuclease V subunit beta [Neisseria animalis]VEE08325.1 exodeoxyribonuclease V subunit beta [Neisseria animalis]
MTTAQPFHPLLVPISGTNLIEASAGTGKTYGIAALFTRLVVLEQMPVENILVVTFTKAATAELKTRLRNRLDNVLQILEAVENANENTDGLTMYCHQEYAGDTFLPELLQKALAQETQARLVVRLKAAIGQFDNAAIYTIHGFCQRILRDYAFLCQTQFDVELSEEQHDRLLVPAQDFWRKRVSHDPVTARLVFKHNQTPQKILQGIQRFINRPYLVCRRPENDLPQAQHQAAETWQSIRLKLADLEETFWRVHPALNGNSYKKNTFANLFAVLKTADGQNRLPEHSDKPLDKLPMFAADILEAKIKKGQTPDLAAFADLQALANLGRDLERLAAAEQHALTLLQLDLLEHLNSALAQQKKTRRERGFDDLLLDVYTALTDNPHRHTLAETVAQNWRVALIDEFQDTDPLQYEIFRKIFINQERPLFLVGDPKQAIYSFRGADIYAYLQAAADARSHYTLTVNYRSHAKLVNSIGALFRQKDRPFVLANIDYAEVGAAREHSRLNPPRPAVSVRWLNQNTGKSENKDLLRKQAAEYCADEIAYALFEAAKGRLHFKDRPLQSGDIAVLVRTHNEGSLIAKSLKKRKIQSVLLHRESVFATAEAAALAALIGFWLTRRTADLRFVLGSVLFHYTAEQLYALNQDDAALLAWTDSAREAATLWKQHGFYAAMQGFAARHHIETRLLADGMERSLTNYQQLLELLAAEDEQSRTPASLHKWLLEQIHAATEDKAAGEHHTVRLESDEALVKIVTMHASKGLQYPLVYCPFVWDAAAIKPNDWQILHRRDGSSELLAKQQLDEADQIQLGDETASENLRLLYVALTRAEEQLNIYAGHCSNTADNTFAYLLEGGAAAERQNVHQTYKNEKNAAAQAQMLKNNWLRFIEAQQHNPDVEFAFTEEAPYTAFIANRSENAACRFQAAEIPARRFEFVRHTSFTGLSRHVKTVESEREELQPAVDAAESAILPEMPSANPHTDDVCHTIHHFPRGVKAGVCLHEILERLDFSAPAIEQSTQTAEILARYGFEDIWLPAVNAMIDYCRTTPLTGNHALGNIKAACRLPEMGFTLYMRDFNLTALRAWFARPDSGLPPECIQASEHLDFQDLQGFLNGFIDMVCQDADGNVCVIDYKSNHLGNDETAYTTAAMNEAMAHHHYYLQALIYAIAVARHFKLRGQTLEKISARYLFLRGMDGSQNGIWSWDIPTADLTEWLS